MIQHGTTIDISCNMFVCLLNRKSHRAIFLYIACNWTFNSQNIMELQLYHKIPIFQCLITQQYYMVQFFVSHTHQWHMMFMYAIAAFCRCCRQSNAFAVIIVTHVQMYYIILRPQQPPKIHQKHHFLPPLNIPSKILCSFM